MGANGDEALREGVRAMVVGGNAPTEVIVVLAEHFGEIWIPSALPADNLFLARLREAAGGLRRARYGLAAGEELLERHYGTSARSRGGWWDD